MFDSQFHFYTFHSNLKLLYYKVLAYVLSLTVGTEGTSGF